MVGNKLGISDGEVPGIILRVAYKKTWEKKDQGNFYQVALVRVWGMETLRMGENIEDSELWYSLVSEGGSEIGLPDEVFELNEYGKVDGISLIYIL